MTMRTTIVVGIFVGVVIAGAAILGVYEYVERGKTPILPTPRFHSEKELINSYLTQARAVHDAYKRGEKTREETKQTVLSMVVPSVMRQRHLEWVLHLDAGRDELIEAMMQEYSAVTLIK